MSEWRNYNAWYDFTLSLVIINNLYSFRKDACFFKCQEGDQCLPESAVCDGNTDCIDGSDESYCGIGTYILFRILNIKFQNVDKTSKLA